MFSGNGTSFSALLLTLVFQAAIVMGSPGPATTSAAAVGAAYGFGRSVGYVSGLILGTAAVLLVVATGVFAVLLSVPRLGPLLIAASAVYMLYLAYRIATAPPLSIGDADGSHPSFAAGFLLAIANPKAYVAIAAVYAGVNFGRLSPSIDVPVKLVVLCLMIVVIHAVWLLAGTFLSGLFRDPVSARIANLVFAAVLVLATVLSVL
jgi:threonine/homoserine/homoserine lactone efflux protein